MMTKTSLALIAYGVKTNTQRDVTLCEFVDNLIESYGENPFALGVRNGDYSICTMSSLLKLLTNAGVLIRLKNGIGGGRGVKEGSIFVFNGEFLECVRDKEALLRKISEVVK